MAGTCERGDERSVSIKFWNLLTIRGTVGFLRTVLCAPCSEFVCLLACLLAYLLTYLLTYLLAYILTYLLTYLLLSTPSVCFEAHFRLVQ